MEMEKEIIDKIVEDLQGTTDSMTSALEYYGIKALTDEAIEYFDEQIFLCSTCGWWCSVDELYDDGICNECNSDE